MASIDVMNVSPTDSRVPEILVGVIVPTILSSIFVVARLYTRTIITRNWGHDDTLISIAWFTSIGLAATNALTVRYGSGRHVEFQKLSDAVPTLKIVFIGRLLYQFTLCLTKLGICVFYLRVFQDKTSKYIVYAIAAFTTISAIITECEFITQCSPVSNAWVLVRPNCKPANPSVIANAVCNIVADVWIMAFVIPRLWPLQMPKRQKASLLIVVSLGVLVIVSSVVRCLLVTNIGSLSVNNDPTWQGSSITTWTTVEVATGLFCASAPTIRPLLRQVAPGLMSSISGTFSGRAEQNTHPRATNNTVGSRTSRLGLGSVRLGRKEPDFELSSRGQGSFWVDDEESLTKSEETDDITPMKQKDLEAGRKDIMKTVSISVTDSDATAPKKMDHGW